MRKMVCFLGMIIINTNGVAQNTDFNPVAFSQQISYTLDEYKRQEKLKEQQTISTAEEAVNEGFWDKYKKVYKRVQERLSAIDFALQAIPTGIIIYKEIEEIKIIESRIWQELYFRKRGASIRDIRLLRKIFNDYSSFGKEIEMIVRYLTGLVISYGAINQMEKAERQTLLRFGLDEVKRVKQKSLSILEFIILAKHANKRKRDYFNYIVKKDKQIVETVIKNIKTL